MSSEMIITLAEKTRVNASYRGMEILTDQRPESGGEGVAPEPFSLFLASLGTCAGYYVLQFCSTRGIPFEGIRLIQRSVRDPERPNRIAKLQIDIELPAEFPERYIEAVVRAANGCTVKKYLHEPFEIEIRATPQTD